MQALSVSSLAPDVNTWLGNSRHPGILHVFDSACNLINERREVLSVVTRQIGNGPFNLVVEENGLFSEHLNIESSILIQNHRVILEDLTINTANAKVWSPRPDWKRLHVERDHLLNQMTKLSIPHYHFSNSRTSDLSHALANADMPSSVVAAKELAGLGQGLTPAGDDFILGSAYATRIIHPPDVARVLVEGMMKAAAPLTTSLSAAWLRSAGKGEAGVLWHEFFTALVSADHWQVQQAADRILTIGETSGADALAGFTGTLSCWREKAGS